MAELVSLDDFTMAYGLILLCEGIGSLTGPPVAGKCLNYNYSTTKYIFFIRYFSSETVQNTSILHQQMPRLT